MPISINLRAALFMVIAMAGFTTNDAITKHMLETLGLGQVILVRGFFATVMILLLALGMGALARPGQVLHPVMVVRALCEVMATLSFMGALAHMPLANISAVLQALPLAVTMGAALFLGERVRWRRWMAIVVGFVGVMVIVQPGYDGFNAFSLLALLCVVFAAARDLLTRSIPQEVPTLLISTVTATLVTAVGGAITVATGDWKPLTPDMAGLLFGAAVLVLIGYQFIILAMRRGDISFVAPFRYTALVWALALGYLAFGEVPGPAMIAGAALIVASGLYTFNRERRAGQGKPAAESTGPAMAPDGL